MVGIAGRSVTQLYLTDRTFDVTGRTIYVIDIADYLIAQLAMTQLYLTERTLYLTGRRVYVIDIADDLIALPAV